MFPTLGPLRIRPSCSVTRAVAVVRRDKYRRRLALPRFQRLRRPPASTAISKPPSNYPLPLAPLSPGSQASARDLCAMLIRRSSALCQISPSQLRCSSRQFGSRRNPLNRSRSHHQKRRLQEQPVETCGNSHREDRDKNQSRKFQHGDHDVPPTDAGENRTHTTNINLLKGKDLQYVRG